MNTFKNNLESNYTALPNYIGRDDRLSWKAKGILLYLAGRPNDWNFYMTEIEKNATDGSTSLKSGIKELEKYGYLNRERKHNENGDFSGMIWVLSEPTHQGGFSIDAETQQMREASDVKEGDIQKKELTKKELTKKEDKYTGEFEEFWDLYDNKVGKHKSFKKWKRLTEAEKQKIMDNIPIFKTHYSEGYLPYPQTYMNNRYWEDEKFQQPKTTKQTNNGKINTTKLAQQLDRAFADQG